MAVTTPFDHLSAPATWPERSMQRWCAREWHIHEARSRHPRYASIWPTREVFKARWPLLAPDLIVGAWRIEEAAAGRTGPAIEYEKLDPPEPPEESWQAKYAAELADHPAIAWDMVQRNPQQRICRRARLTPPETDIARFWLAGNDARDNASLTSIARATGEQKRTVGVLLHRIRIKFHQLAEDVQQVA